MDENSPDRAPLELTDYPLLNRAVMAQSHTGWKHRYPIMGEVVEGFEIWLPYLVPVYQSSVLEMKIDLSLDMTPIEVEFSVARFRRKARKEYG